MDRACGTCDLTFKNNNYPGLLYCHECCEYVRHGDPACERHNERTDGVQQVTRDLYELVKELTHSMALHLSGKELTEAAVIGFAQKEAHMRTRLEGLGVDIDG